MTEDEDKTDDKSTESTSAKHRHGAKSNFSKRIYRYGFLSATLCALPTFVCVSTFLFSHPLQFIFAGLFCLLVFLFFNLIIAPLINRIETKKIDAAICLFKNEGLKSLSGRTWLYEKLTQFPRHKALETFCFAVAISAATLFFCYKFPKTATDLSDAFIAFLFCLFASYITALAAYYYSEKVASTYSRELVKEGIAEEKIEANSFFGIKRKWFGLSFSSRTILFLFLPVVFANALSFLVLRFGLLTDIPVSSKMQITRIVSLSVFSFAAICVSCFLVFRYLRRTSSQIRGCVTEVLVTGNSSTQIQTSRIDRIQYNAFLLTKVFAHYENLMRQFSDIGKNVLKSTESLSEISDKISLASERQNDDVKEILSKMNDSNFLSKNVFDRTSEVFQGTDSTKHEISEVFYLLKENVQQLMSINSSNKDVISGVENLAEQIDSIGDILKIIKDVADQTNIIAFNAELEAVASGRKGRNFHVIATEIRRLASSTMESIEQIKFYIDDIQRASDDLIKSSEKNTELILNETQATHDLEEKFAEIMQSSNETNEKTSEIKNAVEQQTNSFNQIVVTLSQISSGIENFALSTKTISNTVSEMKNVAFNLSDMKVKG